MSQIRRAAEIAEIKYSKGRICWVFDNSSCHNAMGDDALNVNTQCKEHERKTQWS